MSAPSDRQVKHADGTVVQQILETLRDWRAKGDDRAIVLDSIMSAPSDRQAEGPDGTKNCSQIENLGNYSIAPTNNLLRKLG